MPAQLTNALDFQKWAQASLLQQVYAKLVAGKGALISNVQDLVEKALLESPEYQSLVSGRLRTSFGLENAEVAANAIVKAVLDSTVVINTLSGNEVTCQVLVLKDDFSEVLSLNTSSYTYEGRAKTLPSGRRLFGGAIEIDWLEWLLFKGNSLIITDAQIATVSPTIFSRTSSTIMIHPRNPKGWAVPSEFAGEAHDNWLTRALSLQSQVIDLIYKIIS